MPDRSPTPKFERLLPMTPSQARLFLAKTERQPGTGCLLWTGAQAKGQVGSVSLDGLLWGAHRLAYMQWVGHLRHRQWVVHVCPDGATGGHLCVEPSHLRKRMIRRRRVLRKPSA